MQDTTHARDCECVEHDRPSFADTLPEGFTPVQYDPEVVFGPLTQEEQELEDDMEASYEAMKASYIAEYGQEGWDAYLKYEEEMDEEDTIMDCGCESGSCYCG